MTDQNPTGGTGLQFEYLRKHVDPKLLAQFQICTSVPEKAGETKRTIAAWTGIGFQRSGINRLQTHWHRDRLLGERSEDYPKRHKARGKNCYVYIYSRG